MSHFGSFLLLWCCSLIKSKEKVLLLFAWMVTSNSTGKSRPSCFQWAKEHYTIAPLPFIVAMSLHKHQAPFELSLKPLVLLPTSVRNPPCPSVCVARPLLGVCPCGMGRRGMCAGRIPAAGRNGAGYVTASLPNEVKLCQLCCRSFQRVWGCCWLKGKSGMCSSGGCVSGCTGRWWCVQGCTGLQH